jgi:hypothetical protein
MTTTHIHDLCRNIVIFPRVTSQDENVSFYSLLRKSGYFEMHDTITIEAIRESLLEYPDYVNDWIQYSEDQRCHPTWFLQRNGMDYEVGFISLDTDDIPLTKFSDPLEACATFIKYTIEGVRLAE